MRVTAIRWQSPRRWKAWISPRASASSISLPMSVSKIRGTVSAAAEEIVKARIARTTGTRIATEKSDHSVSPKRIEQSVATSDTLSIIPRSSFVKELWGLARCPRYIRCDVHTIAINTALR